MEEKTGRELTGRLGAVLVGRKREAGRRGKKKKEKNLKKVGRPETERELERVM